MEGRGYQTVHSLLTPISQVYSVASSKSPSGSVRGAIEYTRFYGNLHLPLERLADSTQKLLPAEPGAPALPLDGVS